MNMALGTHLTLEYYDCSAKILADAGKMEAAFIAAAKCSGATVLGSNFHAFEPQGVSGFVIIAESHFSVHAWPEYGYAAVDIFTCGDTIDFDAAIKYLREAMHSGSVVISGSMNRGMVGDDGVEKFVPVFDDNKHSYVISWRKLYEQSDVFGISMTLDIYGAAKESFDTDKITSAFAIAAEKFGFKLKGELKFKESTQNEGKIIEVVQLFDQGSLSGQFVVGKDNIYLNLHHREFFEPRDFAELMMQLFDGKHYRMQPTIRQ